MISIYSGYMTERHPVATDTLVFTSDDPATLVTLSETFGGRCDDKHLISEATELVLSVEYASATLGDVTVQGTIEGLESLGTARFRTSSPTVFQDIASTELETTDRVRVSLEPGRVRRQRVAVVA